MFWEYYAKEHIEQFIKDDYGYAIILTNKNLKILQNSKPFITDDENTN